VAQILYVEDHPALRDVTTRMLELAGYEVVPARDGYEALRAAYAQPPDLIVVDLRLPGLDGFEVIEQLRAHPATHHTPIIATSAWANETYRERSLVLGANAHLTTPVDLEQLIATIKQLLTEL
jgi:CheY-like chemotaxis protein